MANLKIIKASAGSGKTHTLTGEYLLLLFKNVDNLEYYRNILAVTFTNKASAEMKERIVSELDILASGSTSLHLSKIIEQTGLIETRVRLKAGQLLEAVLHGYSWFRVETIDSFFQGIMRGFVRELNIPGYHMLEMDTNKVLSQSIASLLNTLNSNKKLLNWVLAYVEGKLDEGKSWKINKELEELGRELFNEKVSTSIDKIEEILQQDGVLPQIKKQLQDIVRQYENKLTDIAGRALKAIEDKALIADDFYYKGAGTLSYFQKIQHKDFELPGSRMLSVLEDPDKWANKKTDRPGDVIQLGTTLLNPSAQTIISILTEEGETYNTVLALLRYLHVLGLLVELSQEISVYRKEEGVSLISDAGPLIRKIIDNNDAPFIYEKTGNRYKHILIDEFQDTSAVQWGNFKPLIENCLSIDGDCLLVGDVKQSIYRWRNSDWEILADKVNKEFLQQGIVQEVLEMNWRSQANIVRFNNSFFTELCAFLDLTSSQDDNGQIAYSDIYFDVAQKVPSTKDMEKGHVLIREIDTNEADEGELYCARQLVEDVNECLSKGYKPGDMAVLVRSKKEGADIAQLIIQSQKQGLFSEKVGVISNESLNLNASRVVQLLLSALKFVYNPDDYIAGMAIFINRQLLFSKNMGTHQIPETKFDPAMLNAIDGGFVDDCRQYKLLGLYHVVELLVNRLHLYEVEEEKVYLHSFLDVVYNYSSKESADLSGFLQFWDEEGDKKTISASETVSAIQIYTIHKSKGLQFPVVFMPYCDWSLKPKANSVFWVKPQLVAQEMPFMPVSFSNALENSLFRNEYYHENYLTTVDNLNLLYVAFTRAENGLFIYNKAKRSKDTLSRTGDLLHEVLETLIQKKQIEKPLDDCYKSGELDAVEDCREESELYMNSGKASSSLPDIGVSRKALEFMNFGAESENKATEGRIWHSIMERVISDSDIDLSVQRAFAEGVIDEQQKRDISKNLKVALNNQKVKPWFDGTYKVLAEQEIVGLNGLIRRPDRIMLGDNKVLIVDYKFGSPDENNEHKRQVEEYKGLLHSMGYKNIYGYIWYVQDEEIIEV